MLVWLRLAEPAARELGEIDRSRRIARLVRAAWRHHLLVEAGARPRRVARSAARLRRQAASAARHAGLGTDPAVTDRTRPRLHHAPCAAGNIRRRLPGSIFGPS